MNKKPGHPRDHGSKVVSGKVGKEIKIGHLNAYVAKPASPTEKGVIVLQDIFGWQSSNTREMADMLSSAGYIAVLPDFFLGKKTLLGEDKTLPQNLKERKPTDINKEVNVVLEYLKEEGANRIGVVGFCWGGEATHHLVLQYPEFKAGVSCCGIACDKEENCQLKSPTLFIFAEKDDQIKLDQVKKFENKLKNQCTADFQVKVFPEQTHGFAHRNAEDIKMSDRPYIQEARRDIITWLNKYL